MLKSILTMVTLVIFTVSHHDTFESFVSNKTFKPRLWFLSAFILTIYTYIIEMIWTIK